MASWRGGGLIVIGLILGWSFALVTCSDALEPAHVPSPPIIAYRAVEPTALPPDMVRSAASEAPAPVAGELYLESGAADVSKTSEVAPSASEPDPIQTIESGDAEIRAAIVQRSVSNYSGSCACPYSVDRGGRRCGGRSAYSRPGGASPLCYPEDVADADVQRFRTNN